MGNVVTPYYKEEKSRKRVRSQTEVDISYNSIPWNIHPDLNLYTLDSFDGMLYKDVFNEEQFESAGVCVSEQIDGMDSEGMKRLTKLGRGGYNQIRHFPSIRKDVLLEFD